MFKLPRSFKGAKKLGINSTLKMRTVRLGEEGFQLLVADSLLNLEEATSRAKCRWNPTIFRQVLIESDHLQVSTGCGHEGDSRRQGTRNVTWFAAVWRHPPLFAAPVVLFPAYTSGLYSILLRQGEALSWGWTEPRPNDKTVIRINILLVLIATQTAMPRAIHSASFLEEGKRFNPPPPPFLGPFILDTINQYMRLLRGAFDSAFQCISGAT